MTKPNGQSVIEVSGVCLSLLLLLKGIGLVFQLTAGSIWVDHHLYQHLICRAEGRSRALCRKRLIRNIKALYPGGAVTRFRAEKEGGVWKGEIKWTLYGIQRDSRERLILP